MKERPIIFSAPMVRAILASTKSQTRRVVKPQPPSAHNFAGFTTHSTCSADEGKAVWAAGSGPLMHEAHRVRCPYGQPGDRLWVREAFQPLFADGVEHGDGRSDYGTGEGYSVRYAATADAIEWIDRDDNITSRCYPSIHMPRWASRILLEVVDVRVERLQDISEADANAEGCDLPAMDQQWTQSRSWFRELWNEINGAGSWDANPWVWAVTFRVLP